MKFKGFFLFLICVFFSQFSCKNESNQLSDVVESINSLKTSEQQSTFLENIHFLDQKVRVDESEVVRVYGDSSPEHQESWRLINQTDKINLEKVEQFMKTFGHPTIEKHGEKATGTPWLVIHHSSDYDPRVRNFHFIYEAFKKGDINSSAFSFFMGRMHNMKYGEFYSWDRPYTEDEEVDTLINRLDLRQITAAIDSKYQ